MALTKNIQPVYEVGDINEHPLDADAKVYLGSAVGQVSGGPNARALIAGDKFLGFAIDEVDNTGGGAGAKRVRVKHEGMIVLTVTGVTNATAPGTSIYASDDDTFTTTPDRNSLVGKFHRWITGTKCVVAFNADLI